MPLPRVDFYLLKASMPKARWLLACRLLEKAYLRGHQVFVYCNNQHDAQTLDELLWTFKEDSFIPHNIQGEGPELPPAIQLGYGEQARGFNDILLNLATTIPPFYDRFQRVMELVDNEEEAKALSREHYRHYKAQGYTIHTHQIE